MSGPSAIGLAETNGLHDGPHQLSARDIEDHLAPKVTNDPIRRSCIPTPRKLEVPVANNGHGSTGDLGELGPDGSLGFLSGWLTAATGGKPEGGDGEGQRSTDEFHGSPKVGSGSATFQVETTSKGALPSCFGSSPSSAVHVSKAPPSPRSLFAARLKQARTLRGVPSQRALGLLMGLEKHVAANRVNRYESQARGIDLDGLGKLAEVLGVPVAYLVAEDAATADAVLALAQLSPEQRVRAVAALLKVAATDDGAD